MLLRLKRKETGKSQPQVLAISSRTSFAKRRRFSSEPPYSSVRWLKKEIANWSIRYPSCTAWTSMPSKPARLALKAPLPKDSMMLWISSTVRGRQVLSSQRCGMADGATGSNSPRFVGIVTRPKPPLIIKKIFDP